MTQYQVDSDAVLAGASSTTASISRLQTEIGALHGQLTALEGSWTGLAAINFQNVVAEWRAIQLRVEENLGAIQRALALAAQQYADVELANARMFTA